jgi:hypothetical protein
MFFVAGGALLAVIDASKRKNEAVEELNQQSELKQDLLVRLEASRKSPHEPEVTAAEVAYVIEQADSTLARVRRNGVTVRYFQAEILERSGVLDSLKSVGFRVEGGTGRFTAAPNSVAYGSQVQLEDVKLLAVVMLRSGLPIKRIRPFQREGGRSNVIEIVHTPALQELPPLTVDEILGLSDEILQQTRYTSAATEG